MNEYEGVMNQEIGDVPRRPLPKLKGYPYEVETFSIFYRVMTFIAVIGILAGIGFFMYYVSEGRFQSYNNQNVDVEPLVNVTTNNQVNYNPIDNNEYKIYLNATIIIPNVVIYSNSSH